MTTTAPRSLRVGVLGCTGMVGQRFVQLLCRPGQPHPWFVLTGLGASERSAGLQYGAASRHWTLPTPCPAHVAAMTMRPCDPASFTDCDLVFSALDSSIAGTVESAFAAAGIPVFSNSKNHRMDENVPLVVPLVNPEHLHLVAAQQREGKSKGFIVCNPNCSSTGLVVVLRALDAAFGLESFIVTTMQAVSGAGYPGVSSLDILDNVIPYISGEEDKLETEPSKILGTLKPDHSGIHPLPIKASAMCNRVAVIDGHTECLSVRIRQRDVTSAQVQAVLENCALPRPSTCSVAHLPTLGENFKPLVAFPETQHDRPQPRLDRDLGGGFTVSVGRVRPCPILDFKMVLLSHNTIIGAAGGALLNAELAVAMNLISAQ
ncbi:aspartate-semialdehyde dehydrogenase [Capsaspora owczarzaki ATCC 30864]|uniref:Aspartate-semialdehyde dehydrogenase n=1 Tax=Capsaspora owczarzaki (strain ATCC 30864) TaxID=595528 RepID=A0A0D2WQ08_CAPO3|nr:aspartate-semialdehyde dehydrogenase [Capsaspora owczarzaki ATCC 30864]KJE93600.1 aspartate-semialdehyde dehydrogenase [Capsaspora owczarzaki ATCC 30864]|eukprot:XP_004348190.1 aspartate-semialdehyde dehydrogenase [Capsaspora owczarzaki ATCC 30864]